MLAHELKNPLASIGLAISTLSQSKETQSSNDQRRIENINAAILSMDNIIERCSLINSIDQNTITLNPIELHLSGFISTLVDSLNCRDQVVIEASENIFLRTTISTYHSQKSH
jgi:signal transduction histidine kinase